uniref:FAD-binding oxidoreductase n=1 Tax=Nonomuraea pusilla TaxID=46177 RepID=UPI000A64A689|nr:FAD-binding oxidoreductase [Nonomuraea pusilla]
MSIDEALPRGRMLVPGDEGFEQAARPWNLAVEQRVRAVVQAEDAEDVAAVVSHARRNGLRVAVQAGGHGAADGLDGEILLRTSRMRGVDVRPDTRVARVEAGASWGEVLAAAGKYGLTGLAGSSPVVSATGFTLGGGLSWFGRAYGPAGSAVRALEVVDAEGVRRRVTAESDPELFWALRGGGGDFAAVTAMEIDLFPAPSLYGGRMLWPIARAEEVMAAFRRITASAPEELTVWFALMQFPPFPQLPEPLRGLAAVAVDVTFLGQEGVARDLLAPLESLGGTVLDTRGPLPVAELGRVCAEPTEPGAGMLRAELLTDLDGDAARTLLDAAGRDAVAPLAMVQIRHLGGALAGRDGADTGAPAGDVTSGGGGGALLGAGGVVEEPYLVSMLAPLPAPELAPAIRERHARISGAMAPYVSGRKPFTYLGYGERAAAAFPGDVLERLREVKRRRDPHGVFRSNFPVLD